MGPIALFDKSFLQSLSVDEAVWFDHFFLSNICPLFFVETLADLEKTARADWTPEQEVALIAEKFPEMSGSPSVHHLNLCHANLLRHPVPMTGQILLSDGRPVKAGGQTGVVFKKSPEAEAFSRWQSGEFLAVERLYAKAWRGTLASLNLEELAKRFSALGISGKSCKGLEEAKAIADGSVNSNVNPAKLMELAFFFLNIPYRLHETIRKRWKRAGYPNLKDYAPYAAHVLSVEIFFQIALAANLISTERSSNRVDIAYLFYLPFCMVFISSDKLHRRCAPLFLREDQSFVWGSDLKEDLSRLNEFYKSLPEETKVKGLGSFADNPPKEGGFLVTSLWDRHLPRWRALEQKSISIDSEKSAKLLEHIKQFSEARPLNPEEVDFDQQNPDAVTLERSVRKKRGSWWQLPKDLKASDND